MATKKKVVKTKVAKKIPKKSTVEPSEEKDLHLVYSCGGVGLEEAVNDSPIVAGRFTEEELLQKVSGVISDELDFSDGDFIYAIRVPASSVRRYQVMKTLVEVK